MERTPLSICCICGEKSRARFKGKEYCKKHYMQMYRHNRILERTIYDGNEWTFFEDYAECTTYDRNFKENGKIKFDLDDYERLKNSKIYICNHNEKKYAVISAPKLHKILAHRFILGINNEEYSIKRVVDHVNGDTLDNRKKNLRICSQKDNMTNIKKNGKIVGVNLLKNGKYSSRLMKDYISLNIGVYDTYEEAVLARIEKEKELCGEYGSNSHLYYILETNSPLEELKKVLKQ